MARHPYPQFRGRIFQVIEALDYGDAVSNQVLAIDRLLAEAGFDTAIHCQWFFETMAGICHPLKDLAPTEHDIVILHFAGYSEYALPYVEKLYCTKICDYHNITPQEFFEPGSELQAFCQKGRDQLARIVAGMHHFWGDSQYNLDELIERGAPRERCSVVPIVVGKSDSPRPASARRKDGAWAFLGRVVANKSQVELVRLFAAVHARRPELARTLHVIGKIQEGEPYAQSLRQVIEECGLQDKVSVTGKVGDEEVEGHLARASIYVSLSLHEGFGVPLIEAAHHGLPVVALSNTAIDETLGPSRGLVDSQQDAIERIIDILDDEVRYQALIEQQLVNARRFEREPVRRLLLDALQQVLPATGRFNGVSVVICTYNRASLLDRCLDYLQYQTDQSFEVVVVNGPSTDDTEAVMARHASRIKIGRNPEANLSKSRNIGIELSAGDLVAFIDDDAMPFDDWIHTLLAEFNSRPLSLSALGGPAYFAGTLEFQAKDIGINRMAEALNPMAPGQVGTNGWYRSLLGTNTCFRADALRLTRGFDEEFDYFLDESELCFRLQQQGWLVGYCPDLYLRHEFAQSGNREGMYRFNWFSICKNTAYFIAAYSGLKGAELHAQVNTRLETERVKPLDNALAEGKLSQEERDRHVARIREGGAQGLADAALYPRTRSLAACEEPLLPFAPPTKAPLIGRDLRPLHICLLTREFPPFSGTGGIGTLYYHLATELLQMGHHVTVVTPGAHDFVHVRGRFRVQYVGPAVTCTGTTEVPGFANNLNWGIRALGAIAGLHQEAPVDVVDSALWDSEALCLALLPPSQRPALVVRLVTPFAMAVEHNGWTVAKKEYEVFMRAERTVIDAADAVLPISQSIARTIEEVHGLKRDGRWHDAPCGVAYWPSFEFRADYETLAEVNGKPFSLPAGAKMVLFVGRLERRKGIDVLLKAARLFLADAPDAWLVIAGRDTDNWTQRLPEELGPEAARVRMLGEVDTPTREKLLHAAHCLVFPSRYESFGLVPLEAFVHGKPVVAARSGAIPEVVVDGQCGLLYPAEDPDALAAQVGRLLGDTELHARLVQGARQRVRHFSSRRSSIQAVTLYLELVSGTPGVKLGTDKTTKRTPT